MIATRDCGVGNCSLTATQWNTCAAQWRSDKGEITSEVLHSYTGRFLDIGADIRVIPGLVDFSVFISHMFVFISITILDASCWWLFPILGRTSLTISGYRSVGTIFSSTGTMYSLHALHHDKTPVLCNLVFGERVVPDAISVVLFNTVRRINASTLVGKAALHILLDFSYLYSTSTFRGVTVGFLIAKSIAGLNNIITRWVVPNVFKFGIVDPIDEMIIDTERHSLYVRAEGMQFLVGVVYFRTRIRVVHSSVMVFLIVTVMGNIVDGSRKNQFVLLARVAVLDDFKDDLSHLGWKLLSKKVDAGVRDLNLLLRHPTKVDSIDRCSEMLLISSLLGATRIGYDPYWKNDVSSTFSFAYGFPPSNFISTVEVVTERRKDTRDDRCPMIPKTWRHDIMGVLVAIILFSLVNSEYFDLEIQVVAAFVFPTLIHHPWNDIVISIGRSVLFVLEFTMAVLMILLMGIRDVLLVLSYINTMFGSIVAQEVPKACSEMVYSIFQLLYCGCWFSDFDLTELRSIPRKGGGDDTNACTVLCTKYSWIHGIHVLAWNDAYLVRILYYVWLLAWCVVYLAGLFSLFVGLTRGECLGSKTPDTYLFTCLDDTRLRSDGVATQHLI